MLDADLHTRLLSLSTPMLADARVRLGLPENHLDPGIRPVIPFSRMAGCAMTVEPESAAPGVYDDLAPLLEAYARPGVVFPIMVISIPPESHHRGIFGEGAANFARQGGYQGVLVEGGVRDTHELRDLDFPTFSRTICCGYIMGKVTVKSVGEPVSIGGRTIAMGDVLLADNDGVMVLGQPELTPVLDKALAIQQWEQEFLEQVAAGKTPSEAQDLVGAMP